MRSSEPVVSVWFSCQPPQIVDHPNASPAFCNRISSIFLFVLLRQSKTTDMAMAVSAPVKVAVANEREIYGLTGDVKKDLLNYLDNIASAGDFATIKSFSELSVNPEIRLWVARIKRKLRLVFHWACKMLRNSSTLRVKYLLARANRPSSIPVFVTHGSSIQISSR